MWGAVGGMALLIGAVLAIRYRISMGMLGAIMAFGAGVLISAVAFDLVEEAFQTSAGAGGVAGGFAAGALVFFFGDALIDRMGGADRKDADGDQASGNGLAIVLGSVLDGIPESIVLGISLLGGTGVSTAFIAAVFLSNLPEGLAATSGLVAAGWPRNRILWLWTAVVAVSATAALAGYGLFDAASARTVAFVLSFAGGAILVMLADTMMPEAYEHEGKLVGLCTAAGFALAFALHTID